MKRLPKIKGSNKNTKITEEGIIFQIEKDRKNP